MIFNKSLFLGAWPVFKSISLSSPIPDQIGLLTGRLSIIPTNKMPSLLTYIESSNVKAEPIGSDGQYQKVTAPLNQLTSAFTVLLMNGDIKLLVGTRSLLGEGWDAPAINSLVLASSVGSFMLTNQMRGRAIRINPKEKEKVSTIWHLVAINIKSSLGWSDLYNLEKRFETFVGLSEKELTIESGFERMKATSIQTRNIYSETAPITGNNRQMLRRYRRLNEIPQRWHQALTLNDTARVTPSIKTNKIPELRGLLLKHSLSYLLIQLTAIIGVTITCVINSHPRSISQLLIFMLVGIVGVLIYKLPKTISIIKIVFLYLPVDGALKQIAKSLVEALCRAGFIKTPIRKMKVNVTRLQDGTFHLSLSGGSVYESSLFADCLSEILSPIDNPRYLVLREGKFLGKSREDYHAVPIKFAVKKDFAQIFYR